MQAMVLPPGALDSYIRGPTPMATEGGRERSDPGTGRFWPCARTGQNCRETAGTRGTATLQVTTQALSIQVNNNCYNSIYVMSHVMFLVLWVLIYSISLLYYYGNILC